MLSSRLLGLIYRGAHNLDGIEERFRNSWRRGTSRLSAAMLLRLFRDIYLVVAEDRQGEAAVAPLVGLEVDEVGMEEQEVESVTDLEMEPPVTEEGMEVGIGERVVGT